MDYKLLVSSSSKLDFITYTLGITFKASFSMTILFLTNVFNFEIVKPVYNRMRLTHCRAVIYKFFLRIDFREKNQSRKSLKQYVIQIYFSV